MSKKLTAKFSNGQIAHEVWKNEAGEYHRLDGPAYQEWYENGQLSRKGWYINDLLHSIDGPAYQEWYENGQVNREEWRLNNTRHRLDGPAYRVWGESGLLDRGFWYINGVRYKTEAEFQVAVDLYKANEIAELF